MTALRTGEHILNLTVSRGDAILTSGQVFANCSCGTWRKNGALSSRDVARQLHRDHLEQVVAERFEQWEAQDANR